MALNVPINLTSLGITFVVWPPCTEVIDNTDGDNGFRFRLMICCNATTRCEATRIVSTV